MQIQDSIYDHISHPMPYEAMHLHDSMDIELISFYQDAADHDYNYNDQALLKDGLLEHELRMVGFTLENSNLICVQMINALQSQMDVLEQVIFKNSPLSLFDYGIGFNFDDGDSFGPQNCSIEVKSQPNFGTNRSKKRSPKQDRKTMTSEQAEILRIVEEQWQRVGLEDKMVYLFLRKRISELKKVITQSLTHKEGKQHICVLCGFQFDNGRQLGGHMSRKHPGNSTDYNKKKQLHATKTVERERRRYFKGIKGDPMAKHKPISKHHKPAIIKAEQL